MARGAKKAEVATVVRGTAFAAARREARTLTPRTVDVVDTTGKKVDTIDLVPELFGIEPNAAVVHQIITAQLAARRRGTHSTKTRAEVRGGGKKPWRQKGTGRARQGSTRAPQWTHGGVAHGPKPRSYAQRVNKKMIRLALASSLSSRAAEGRVVVLDGWALDAPKTKTAVGTLRAIGVAGKALAVVDGHDTPEAMSLRNIDGVHLITADQMNAYDIVRAAWLVFTRDSLAALSRAPEADADGPVQAEPAKRAPDAAAKKPKAVAKPAAADAEEPAAVAEPDSAPGVEPESASEPDTAPEPEAELEADPGSAPEAEADVDAESAPAPDAGAEADAETAAEPEAATEPQARGTAGDEAEPESEEEG